MPKAPKYVQWKRQRESVFLPFQRCLIIMMVINEKKKNKEQKINKQKKMLHCSLHRFNETTFSGCALRIAHLCSLCTFETITIHFWGYTYTMSYLKTAAEEKKNKNQSQTDKIGKDLVSHHSKSSESFKRNSINACSMEATEWEAIKSVHGVSMVGNSKCTMQQIYAKKKKNFFNLCEILRH